MLRRRIISNLVLPAEGEKPDSNFRRGGAHLCLGMGRKGAAFMGFGRTGPNSAVI